MPPVRSATRWTIGNAITCDAPQPGLRINADRRRRRLNAALFAALALAHQRADLVGAVKCDLVLVDHLPEAAGVGMDISVVAPIGSGPLGSGARSPNPRRCTSRCLRRDGQHTGASSHEDDVAARVVLRTPGRSNRRLARDEQRTSAPIGSGLHCCDLLLDLCHHTCGRSQALRRYAATSTSFGRLLDRLVVLTAAPACRSTSAVRRRCSHSRRCG